MGHQQDWLHVRPSHEVHTPAYIEANKHGHHFYKTEQFDKVRLEDGVQHHDTALI